MNTIRILQLSFSAVALLAATGAGAQEAGLTRAQVKAELAAARADGTLGLGGESGQRLLDLHPQLYPAAMRTRSATSREAVRAELAAARRNGDLAVGESSLLDREIAPALFPARPAGPGKSRAEVRAELAEATRLGDLVVGEQGRTLAETFPQRYAAARAANAALKARADGQIAQHGGATPR